jgi:hypothetical protein
MTRCLAHDIKPRQFWPCAETCARHVQIRHDPLPSENVSLNHCAFNLALPMHVPLGGFPKDDDPSENQEVKKTCDYPKCTCPFDAPADPNWCARGYPKAAKQ